MRKILLSLFVFFGLIPILEAAPCYGVKLPTKKEVFIGLSSHAITKRYLEADSGKLRSTQHFFLLSYGIFDWLSLDLKGGAGNIKQKPSDSDEIDYSSNFAGGYGLRIKFYDSKETKMVFGFQHISVHPRSTHVGVAKHQAILDDWQVSLLASYNILKTIPYLGLKWSRVDYIHRNEGVRKRVMSDLTKSIGLVCGIDVPVSQKSWLNLEGQFLDGNAFSLSLNYSF